MDSRIIGLEPTEIGVVLKVFFVQPPFLEPNVRRQVLVHGTVIEHSDVVERYVELSLIGIEGHGADDFEVDVPRAVLAGVSAEICGHLG